MGPLRRALPPLRVGGFGLDISDLGLGPCPMDSRRVDLELRLGSVCLGFARAALLGSAWS